MSQEWGRINHGRASLANRFKSGMEENECGILDELIVAELRPQLAATDAAGPAADIASKEEAQTERSN